MVVEVAILIAFVIFLVYMFPTLDPQGYLFYGSAPHAPFLEQEISSTLVTVVRWILFFTDRLFAPPHDGHYSFGANSVANCPERHTR